MSVGKWPSTRANAFVAYGSDVRFFECDVSVGSIGGGIAMPAHSATLGNRATDYLLSRTLSGTSSYNFESSGAAAGADADAIASVGHMAHKLLGTRNSHSAGFDASGRAGNRNARPTG